MGQVIHVYTYMHTSGIMNGGSRHTIYSKYIHYN